MIRNRRAMKQLVDFSGLRYGRLYPTNSDVSLDYFGKAWLWAEIKHVNADLPQGQKIWARTLCRDLSKVKPCIFAYADHSNDNLEEDVDAAGCLVRIYALGDEWMQPAVPMTLRELFDSFIKPIDEQCAAQIAANSVHGDLP